MVLLRLNSLLAVALGGSGTLHDDAARGHPGVAHHDTPQGGGATLRGGPFHPEAAVAGNSAAALSDSIGERGVRSGVAGGGKVIGSGAKPKQNDTDKDNRTNGTRDNTTKGPSWANPLDVIPWYNETTPDPFGEDCDPCAMEVLLIGPQPQVWSDPPDAEFEVDKYNVGENSSLDGLRIGSRKHWWPRDASLDVKVSVKFKEPMVVTAVMTRGSTITFDIKEEDFWVQQYKISVDDNPAVVDKLIFDANWDVRTVVTNELNGGKGYYVNKTMSIQPIQWHDERISFKFELRGCKCTKNSTDKDTSDTKDDANNDTVVDRNAPGRANAIKVAAEKLEEKLEEKQRKAREAAAKAAKAKLKEKFGEEEVEKVSATKTTAAP